MVHIEQILWPTAPNYVELHNMTETEMWVFKERLYKGLCKATSKPEGGLGSIYHTIFEDNAETCFRVWTNGNPEMAWCYITEIGKIKCEYQV